MSLGALGLKPDQIEKEIKRVTNIQSGGISGVNPNLLEPGDLEQAGNLEDYLGSPSAEEKTYVKQGACIWPRAVARDVPYSIAGRRYLFTMGLNNKLVALQYRKMLLDTFEEEA